MNEIHPIHERVVSRAAKEAKLRQKAKVIWLFGISAAGKSTLATGLGKRLLAEASPQAKSSNRLHKVDVQENAQVRTP